MGISAFNKKSTLEKCVYTDLLDIVNKFSFDSEKYSINFNTNKSYVSIESSDESMYNKPKKSCVNRFYRIKANIIIKDKKTQETCSKVLTLLDVPYYDQGLIINNSSKELVDSYDRSTGWLIQKDKNTGDDTIKSGFNLTFRDLRREKLNFKYAKSRIVLVKDKTKTLSLGYFLKALTKLNYDEISQKIGDIPCLNRSLINEESLEVCLVETAKFLDLYGKKSDSHIDDLVKSKVSQNPSAVHQDIRNSIFNLKYIKLDSSAKDRYNYKTRFENRADGFELNEDLSINNLKLSRGSILTKEILRKIDESDCTSLSVKKDSILFELKKYPYTGNLNEDDMLTMLNIFAYVIEGLGEEDDNYSLENRQLMNMDKLAHIQITENLNFLCKNTKEYSESDPSIVSILKLLNLGSSKSTNYGSLVEKFTSINEKNLQSQTDTNIISVLSMGTKASTNIDNRAKTTEMVSIQPSSRGRTDPFDAPESQKMGLVQYKCVTTVCEDGQLKVPYIKVKNCKPVSDKPEYLLPYEDKVAFIAQFDEDFKEEKILVRHDDDFVFVDRDKVNYMEYSPYQGSGISTSLMPFPGNSAGKRINMWDNESRQAVFISGLERPIVGTGFDGFTDEGVVRAKEILSSFYDQNQYSESLGSRENFINSKIKLIDIHSSFEKRILKFKVIGMEIIVEYSIKYIARNIVKNLSSYRIKYSKDLEYQGEDIVVHDIFIDVNKYDVDMRCTDFGHLNVKEADFSKGFAVGINLVVGFKTHGSYTIEDSIVINRRLLGKGSLTSFYMETFDSDARVSEDSVEFFGFSYDNIPSHMNSSGIAKVGETLSPGSMIINKVITNPNKTVKSSKDYKDSPVFLPDHIGGEVVYAGIEEVSSIKSEKVSRAVIIIASTSDVSVGDKFCGRYGNKGVCGKIVEECDMAYNAETGLPLDIVLNPLGVPARMNLSQLLEGLVAFCMKQEGKIALTTPFCKKQGDFIEQLKAEHNFQPQVLTDGRSGRKFEKPINVSVMYFLKLHHTTSTKLNWCSLNAPRQPESLQPGQGVGQKLGEMEFWVLESAQIPRFEQLCKSILSDDMNASNNLINSLKVSSENISIEGSTNPADIWLQVFLRSNGQNLYSEQNNSIIVDDSNNTLEYNVELLTSGKCRSLGSPLKLNSGYGKSSSASALHDTSIFGNCDKSRTRVNHRDKWSYIELGCEIINPFFISSSDHTLIKLLNVWFSKEVIPSTHISTGIRSYINSGENEVTVCKLSSVAGKILKCDYDIVFESDEKERKGYKVAFAIPKGQKLDNIICGSRYSHIDGIVELFKRSSIDDSIERFQGLVDSIKSKVDYKKEDYINALTLLTYCKSLKNRGLDFKDFIIDCYPICPAALRPEINRGNNKNDFDLHYQNIINACNSEDFYKSLKVYFTISNFLGYYEEKDAPCIFDKTPLVSAMKDKNIKNILTKFASPDSSGSNKKKAFFRDKVQSKRVLVSGRSSIVPADINVDYFNEDDIDSLHCGLPFLLALGMYQEFVESYIAETFLNRKDDGSLDISSAKRYIGYVKSNDRKSFSWNDDKYPLTFDELKDKIIEYLETKVVILGRQPSLHILSIRAFRVKIVEGSAIKLNTLFCVGYNGDFDGDQMYTVGCLDKESEEECLRNLSHLASAMAPRDGSCVLQPKQDILVGMYICTMLENNKLNFSEEDVESALSYSNVDRLRNDFYNGDIKFYNLCCLKVSGRYYLSTVGRLVFNSYIEGTFTSNKFTNPWNIPNVGNLDLYSELMFDAIIGEKNNLPQYVSISQVQSYMMDNFSGYEVGLIMDNLARLGFYSSDYYGLSISLSDFVEDEVIDKYNELTNELRQDVENCYIDGFITEEEKQQSILDIYTGCNKIIENEVTKLYGRDNNLFIMRDSGARGSASQLNQSVGMIGIMMKNSNEFFSVPVTGNYLNGLSSYENFITSFGARATFAKTYDETPDSGHLTRIAVYLMSGFKIVEDKCPDNIYPVKLERDEIYKAFVNGKEIKFKDIKNIHDVKEDLLKFVGGKILKEEESETFNCVKYMTTDNSINDDIISVVLKNHFTDLNCLDEFGNEINLKIVYHLSSMFKSLLLYRTCHENIPGLISSGKGKNVKANSEKKYIGKKAIEYLDTHDVKYLKVSLMLNCSSVGGVCAECYGLEKSTKQLPKVGKNIGITAAQSIGEPASQLILSSSNSGGVAGGSVTNAVQLIKTLMTGSLIQKIEKSICAPCQDIVKVTQIGGESMIKMRGVSCLIDSNKVLVKNGEVVKEGQPLTVGYINPNSLYEYNIDKYTILERQLILLHLYYDMFSCNNINLDIRHFEALVRCQSNLVTVTESENPDYVPGLKYELADVISNGGGKVNYIYNALSNSEDVVKNNSGSLSLYGFQYQVKYASNIFSEGRPMKLKSGLDRSMIGYDMTGKTTKFLPRMRNVAKPDSVFKNIEKEDSDSSSISSYISILSNNSNSDSFDVDIDLEDLDLFSAIDTSDVEDNSNVQEVEILNPSNSYEFDDYLDIEDTLIEEEDNNISIPITDEEDTEDYSNLDDLDVF